MKVYLNKLNENWIVDRQRQEFLDNNKISLQIIYSDQIDMDYCSMDLE